MECYLAGRPVLRNAPTPDVRPQVSTDTDTRVIDMRSRLLSNTHIAYCRYLHLAD